MNKIQVLKELNNKYPNKEIVCIPETNPSEILCVIDATIDHPAHSLAVAVIDKSTPHYHRQTTETYKIIKGSLDLFVDGVVHKLNEGDTYTLAPGLVHYAVGNETWIECYSKPGWTPEDHILV